MAKRVAPKPPTQAASRPAPTQTPAPPVDISRSSRIKVRATKLGYYGEARRRPGDVFIISGEQAFSEKWMERVDPGTRLVKTTPAEEARKRDAELNAGPRMLKPNAADPIDDDDAGESRGDDQDI